MEANCSPSLKVESEVKVLSKLMNMTLEDEDEYYGSIKEFISKMIDEYVSYFQVPYEECIYPNTVDLVWEGWEAAFIRSKGREDWPAATLKASHFKKVLGKRKLEAKDGVEEADEEQNFKFQKPKENAVVLLAYHIMECFAYWTKLEDLAGPVCGRAIRKRVFDCLVKFILSIFDEEDYYRVCHWNEIRDEHMRFCRSHAGKDEPLATFSNHKFTYFAEADIYKACLQLHEYQIQMVEYWIDDERFTYSEAEFSVDPIIRESETVFRHEENDVHEALKLMQKHSPLKGYLQAQVMLELSCSKCYHVTDILVLEALNGLNLSEFYGKCMSDDSDVANQYQGMLDLLADIFVCGLSGLSDRKANELKRVEKSLINGPQCVFGPFKNEVYEVMKRANYERRKENKRFTGLAHIWSALSFSRVRDCLTGIVKNHLKPELCLLDGRSSSELYTYTLYELSHHLATHLGEKVGLEHLVFSILYGSSKEKLLENYGDERNYQLFYCLRESQAVSDVASWRNIDVYASLFGKRCSLGTNRFVDGPETVKKLQEVASSNEFVLPKYEDLRVV